MWYHSGPALFSAAAQPTMGSSGPKSSGQMQKRKNDFRFLHSSLQYQDLGRFSGSTHTHEYRNSSPDGQFEPPHGKTQESA